MVKNLSCNARDMGSIPGGGSINKILHVMQQESPCTITSEPTRQSPCTATKTKTQGSQINIPGYHSPSGELQSPFHLLRQNIIGENPFLYS